MTRVVLGSASTGRLSVLRKAGIDPVVVVSGVDEDAVLAGLGARPPAGGAVCALATAKAEQVAAGLDAVLADDCVVLACDSMLSIDGDLRGKPADADAARRAWRAMAGRSGELYTGHSAIRLRNGVVMHRDSQFASTTVHFGTPSDQDLAAYIDSGEPTAVAGGFTLDGLGGWFVERIEGDPSNVIGISLPLTRRMLEAAGLAISAVWQANPPAP
ncbi:MAG TPA: Maf family nucleotide pyrophosphatase [Mycobacterium sp.]|jgi:septum formation protein|nr:Maf family nucleotide pyrophosphatase [Mycobacterium sp.]